MTQEAFDKAKKIQDDLQNARTSLTIYNSDTMSAAGRELWNKTFPRYKIEDIRFRLENKIKMLEDKFANI